jgi:glycosyltransferase involved in cell wall biosynthesis
MNAAMDGRQAGSLSTRVRYSIITPTICRSSLLRLCRSIDRQTRSNWEHLLVVDCPQDALTDEQRKVIASIRRCDNRAFFYCDRRHNNYGHTCRHQIWSRAQGDYILYVDDDDYLADENVLATLDSVTAPWAVFPVLRHGHRFLHLPPGTLKTGTGMFIHQREIGRWHDSDSYTADGAFVDELVAKYPWEVLDSRPLVVLPWSNQGDVQSAGFVRRLWLKLRARHKSLQQNS